uniref:IlGF domain-containing protein n=1 Tax=Steinernema glaseri TaxID=37863 RepID=A0A1I7Z0P6_9BILA
MTSITVSLAVLLVFCSTVLANPAVSGNKFGSLTLCPAGGRSFAMAWSLACEMKRRKRSSGFERRSKMRPATIKEMQKICCVAGCELRDLISYCDPFGGWSN